MNITTLIPAYKTRYIADLLNALRMQTVPTQLVIISDDSPHGEFREVLFSQPYAPLRAGLNIEFVEGPRNGAYENVKQLVRLSQGRSDIVHLLLDDDLIYPEFYERHRLAHASGDFSCVVSRRWTCNEQGLPMAGQPVPDVVARTPSRMNSLTADLVLSTSVVDCCNWFGEFSNATFRADCCDLLLAPELGGVSYAGLWDLGAFVAAGLRRPICHIEDHLGAFRLGPGQNSSNLNSAFMKGALLGFVAIAVGGRRIGKLTDEQVRHCCARMLPTQLQRYSTEPDMAAFNAVLPDMATGVEGAEARFVDLWHAYLAEHGF